MSIGPSNEKSKNDQEIENRSKAILGGRQALPSKISFVQTIINPAAGRDQPILKTLNAAFTTAGVDWDVAITKKPGDGTRLAKKAVEAGADVVLVHGGDGTVMEVASGLVGSQVPLAIVPGGTANVMSHELGIPVDLVEACTLAVNPDATIRKIDMGKIKDVYFMLRAGMGFEAAMVRGADRELKDRVGLLAYALSGLQELTDPQIARYHLVLDGQNVETEGLACIVANSGNIGAAGMSLAPNIDISDGLLDVMVVTKADLPSLIALAATVVGGAENDAPALQHWQVKQVTISSDPPQQVQVDGEMLAQTPIDVQIVPEAVKVIVPPGVNTG